MGRRLIGLVLLLTAIVGPVWADTHIVDDSKAMKLIEDAAEVICGDYQASGSSSAGQASGKAKAQLRGLAKKLAEIGIEGAGSLDIEQYEGVLREQVRDELADIRKCRFAIWKDMRDRLLGLRATSDDPADEQEQVSRALPDLKTEQLDVLECIAKSEKATIEKTLGGCKQEGQALFKLRYLAVGLNANGFLHCYYYRSSKEQMLSLGPWVCESTTCEVTHSGANVLVRERRI